MPRIAAASSMSRRVPAAIRRLTLPLGSDAAARVVTATGSARRRSEREARTLGMGGISVRVLTMSIQGGPAQRRNDAPRDERPLRSGDPRGGGRIGRRHGSILWNSRGCRRSWLLLSGRRGGKFGRGGAGGQAGQTKCRAPRRVRAEFDPNGRCDGSLKRPGLAGNGMAAF